MLARPSLGSLCVISRQACAIMADMVVPFYTSINSETSKLKADKSVFTIADGVVQHLLINHLFTGDKFAALVGEEDDSNVNILLKPYFVDDLIIPEEYYDVIDSVRSRIDELSTQIDPQVYKDITIFIDPIDGTREFSTGLGEQCSICIGFSNTAGLPVAGLVFRPITSPCTWAGGVASEGFVDASLDTSGPLNPRGFLTSNGAISDFIVNLIRELGYERVPSGGAGNKMLMLLEGKGACYIQDRGVSRWDTCGAQAVVEAMGGKLCKLTKFVDNKSLESYTYLKSSVNLDFEPGVANLTPYNADVDKEVIARLKKGEKISIDDIAQAKKYSNLCGLLCLDAQSLAQVDEFYACIQRAKQFSALSYD